MTGLGEHVYEPATEADALVEKAARALAERHWLEKTAMGAHRPVAMAEYAERTWKCFADDARAALSSLGLPLSDLQWAAENAAVVRALRSGELRAVEAHPETRPCPKCGIQRTPLSQCAMEGCPRPWAFDAAPKSPSEEA